MFSKSLNLNYYENTKKQTAETSTYVVYPNPSNAIVYIDLSDPTNDPTTDDSVQGELYDFMGLLKANVEIINGHSSLDVSGLTKGVYVLRIYVNGQVESHLIGVE